MAGLSPGNADLPAMPSTGIYSPRNVDTAGLTPVQRGLVSGERTLVLAIIGQSLAANNTTVLYTAANAQSHCLNPNDGATYPASDPILGASGTLGGCSGRLADKLIASGVFDRVIIANLSVNATAIAEWATGGAMNPIIPYIARRFLICYPLSGPPYVGAIALQDGESDNVLGTSSAAITAGIRDVKASWIAAGIDWPMLVAIQSYWPPAGGISQRVRDGQIASLSDTLGIKRGPDRDTLLPDATYLQVDNHLNATGADAYAELWKATLIAAFPRM